MAAAPAAGAGLLVRCPCCESTLLLEQVVLSPQEPVETVAAAHIRIAVDSSRVEPVVEALKARLVYRAMAEAGGVKSRAARTLGLKYSTFWELAQRLGLAAIAGPPDPEGLEGPELAEAEQVIVHLDDQAGPWQVGVDVAGGRLWRRVLDDVKLALAGRALERAGGNAARGAALTGMKYTTFYSLVRRLRGRAAATPSA